VFRHANYRLYFGGQLVSVTGTWMAQLAQSWLVLTLTDSAFLLGLVPVAQFLPTVMLSLYGGLIADRFPKRKILMLTQFLSAMLQIGLAGLVFTDYVQLWHVYTIGALLGVVNAFDTPARQAFVSEMVAKDDLVQAISLNSAVFNSGRLIGPALAGITLARVGSAWAFLLNGLSFFAVILQLARMDDAKLFQKQMRRTGGKAREGIAYALKERTIFLTIVMIGIISTFAMSFNVWIPLLAKNVFHTGAGGFGLLMSMLGVGSLSGALVLAFIGRRRPPASAIPITAGLLALFELMLAVSGLLDAPFLFVLLVLPLAGFMMTFTASLANSSVQMLAPDHMRGRVMAFYFMIFNAGIPAGAMLAGTTSEHFGVLGSMLFGSSVGLAAALVVGYLGSMSARARAYRASSPVPGPGSPAD
jgi:MFS family permease